MKELDDIINEQVLLLKWNGYTEKQLNNEEAEGSYKEHLKLAVQDILQADNVLLDNEVFQLHLFGYFNEKQDKVLFTFSYEYDAFLSQISLKEVQATLNDIPISIAIEKGSDLWSSQEMYKRVRQLSFTVNNALNEERNDLIKSIILKELRSLHENSYLNPLIENRLNDVVRKIECNKTDQPRNFTISGKYSRTAEAQTMVYRLHYRYDPVSLHLQLKSVYGRVGNTKRVFIATNNMQIPSADRMFTFLKNENKSQKARTIANHAIPSARLRKRLK